MWLPFIGTFFLILFNLANLFGINQKFVPIEFIYYCVGIVSYFTLKKVGWRTIRELSLPLYWFFIFLLVFTYILGLEVKGSRRWIDFYFFNFQASEFFKIIFIAFLANFFVKHRHDIEEFSIFVKSFLYFFLPTFIIFKQPDLGNAMVFVMIYITILFFSNVPKKTIFISIMIFLLFLPLAWFGLKGYQKERITSFLSNHEDQRGSGYNMVQAMITVGSGKFFGRGLGHGTQSKLLFLPENHTDFAFSSLVEQFGFFGGMCLVFFYFFLALFLIRKLVIYIQTNDEDSQYKFLFTLGFLVYLWFQVVINIGMNLGLLPVAGIALPLISYGGSSLVAFMIGLALIP